MGHFPSNAFESAEHAKVLSDAHLRAVKDELARITPMKAAFYPEFVKRLSGDHVKTGTCKADIVEQLRADIRMWKRAHACERVVAVWCASTEVIQAPQEVHRSVEAFEHGLMHDSPNIGNSQLYAWAAIRFHAHVAVLALVLAALTGAFMVSYGSARAAALRLPAPRGAMRRAERALTLTVGVALARAADGKSNEARKQGVSHTAAAREKALMRRRGPRFSFAIKSPPSPRRRSTSP